MNPRSRRLCLGAAAGLLSSPLLALSSRADLPAPVAVLLAVALGALLALLAPTRRAIVESLLAAAALGLPLWALLHVIALPLLAGMEPRWTAAAMREVFPQLAGWILFQALLGWSFAVLEALVERWLGPAPVPETPPAPPPTRILILGGGFAGVATAEQLERAFGGSAEVELTLVSETNAMLFTPMLAEVAASSLEASHITSPLRTNLRRTTVVRGRASRVDLALQRVQVDSEHGPSWQLGYDHVVLALGSVSNYLGMTGVAEHAFDFKSIADAVAIRNHVIDCFERADCEIDAEERRKLLTFVVAGGGFAGAELAGGLNDFVRGMLPYYPRVPRDEVQVVLVHGGERILMELSEPLAAYAQRTMAARGVTFRLKTRLKDATADRVVLSDGEIPSRTLVWTAGTAPNPLLKTLGVEVDKRGAVVTEPTMQVGKHTNVWVLGDAASLPNAATGKACPPTAQFAIRQAKQLARNLRAVLHGEPLRPFRFKPLGALCVVGHHTACAEIQGLRFSGLFAWLLWRGIYLSKLPSLERKVRVVFDWVVELFFPRDIVQTFELGSRRGGGK